MTELQEALFAHLHPDYDGSLHFVLPITLARDVMVQGWGWPTHWRVCGSVPAWSWSSDRVMWLSWRS
jgi:hypothetical protein